MSVTIAAVNFIDNICRTEKSFCRDRIRRRRRRFRYTARYSTAALSRTFSLGCLSDADGQREGEREGVAGRMDFLERSRRNARNESNQDDDGNVGPPHSLAHSLALPLCNSRHTCWLRATPKESHQRASYCAHN